MQICVSECGSWPRHGGALALPGCIFCCAGKDWSLIINVLNVYTDKKGYLKGYACKGARLRCYDWTMARSLPETPLMPGRMNMVSGWNLFVPVSPWTTAIWRVNGKLRDECLNQNAFVSLADARDSLERWRQDYNRERPHSSLGWMTPEEYRNQHQP